MMRKQILSVVLGLGVMLAGARPASAFLEDMPPTFTNGGVDPAKTGDPIAVAEAQRVLDAFFIYTNREFSNKSYANPWLMREEIGNLQSNWLDKTLPLACGRLVSGWKYMNWIPGKGWQHEVAPADVVRGASGSCEFRAPTFANGGVNPIRTADPAAVVAAQLALDQFYTETNLSYSPEGYTSPWVQREELGNNQSDWLDMSLALARGQLIGGWKNMNWNSTRGWCRCAPGTTGVAPRDLSSQAPLSTPDAFFAWSPDRLNPIAPPEGLGRVTRRPGTYVEDPQATQIMLSLRVNLGGETSE